MAKLSTVSKKQLDDALAACERACIAYTQPVEVRPGVKLCASGRVMRAMAIANQQPKEKWPLLSAEIERLSREADAKLTAWTEAEQAYQRLCEEAGIEPSRVLPGEPCDCEGCKLHQDGLGGNESLPALPNDLWSSHASISDAQRAYGRVEARFDAIIGVDRSKSIFVVCARPKKEAA